MLASCGVLGLDWEEVSLSMYFEAVEAHNSDGGSGAGAPTDEFKDFMRGRFGAG